MIVPHVALACGLESRSGGMMEWRCLRVPLEVGRRGRLALARGTGPNVAPRERGVGGPLPRGHGGVPVAW